MAVAVAAAVAVAVAVAVAQFLLDLAVRYFELLDLGLRYCWWRQYLLDLAVRFFGRHQFLLYWRCDSFWRR